MELVLRIIVTVILGGIGGFIARKLKMPAGFMIGSLIVVATINLSTGWLSFPGSVRKAVQILAGAMVGSRVSRDDIRGMRQLVIPSVLYLVYFVLFMILTGVIMWRSSGVSLVTALFGCAPGGMSDMGIISGDYGANTALVTVIQLTRLVSVLLSYPFIFRYLANKNLIHAKPYVNKHERASGPGGGKKPLINPAVVKESLILICAAAIGGLLLNQTGFPSAFIVGGMIGSATANLAIQDLHLDPRMRFFIQVCSGAYIGTLVTRADIITLSESYVSVLEIIASVLILPPIFGFLVHKLTKLDLGTALFGATPGGLQEMSILAEDMGLDSPKISIIHTIRIVCALSFFPGIISIVLRLLT